MTNEDLRATFIDEFQIPLQNFLSGLDKEELLVLRDEMNGFYEGGKYDLIYDIEMFIESKEDE